MNNESRVSGRTPEAGAWDFDGSCAPDSTRARFDTFSVGIFRWEPKARGKGLKRGKVMVRVKGLATEPEKVYTEAHRICDARNARNATEEAP